ncbi:MAG: DUF456 domain-containing protein [Methylophilus sp.]
MEWVLVLSVLLIIVGFLGTFLPVLPGVPLVFIGLLLIAWADGFVKVSLLTMTIIGLLALFSMLIDFVASFITTKKVGASKNAMWGMVIGGLLGLFAGVLGLFFGASIGALIGEFSAHRDASKATVVGLAAGFGFILGLVAKVILALIMLGIFTYAYYY